MKLALIPPIELLEYTDETFCQLMLPHLLVSDVYRYVYTQHCQDPNQWVILDNGAAEGEEFTMSVLMDIAIDMNPDEIVVPDVIGDMTRTIQTAQLFKGGGFVDPKYFYMFVAQGQTLDEFQRSIDWAVGESWINSIGLPRHSIQTLGDLTARRKLAEYVDNESPSLSVHLLGGSHLYPTEIRDIDWPDNVRSTDTSSPFNYAHADRALRVGTQVKRPDGYFDLCFDEFDSRHLDNNVKHMMDWTGNEL